MKNKIIIAVVIFFQIIFSSKLLAKEVNFQAKEIEILKDQNLTIAKNGTAIIKDDGVIIKGEIIEYFKDKSLLIINRGKISTINKNFEINANIIEYKIDESNLDFKNEVYLKDNVNNLVIESNKINYNLNNRKIISQVYSEIFDEFNNIYKVDGFEYSIKDKVVKLNNLVAEFYILPISILQFLLINLSVLKASSELKHPAVFGK